MDVLSIIEKLNAGMAEKVEIDALQAALSGGKLVLAQRGSIAVGESVNGSILLAGETIHFTLTAEALEKLMPKAYLPPPAPSFDQLPAPGTLPPGYHMPFERNQAFTGREQELRSLAKNLPGPVAVTGPGGVGKSQLVVEFCYRWGRYFHGVHWINAIHPETIAAEIAVCGAEMGLPGWPNDQPSQIQRTLRAWQEQPLRLVILDNLEEPAALQTWLPRLVGVHLVITSRQERWPGGLLKTLVIETLPRPKSLVLLQTLAPRLSGCHESQLNALAERLGDWPLALDLAGRYLEDRPGISTDDYLHELDTAGSVLAHTSQKDWTTQADSPTDHATSLHATFQLSWQRLAEKSPIDARAAQLFCLAGWCAPNTPVPPRLLWQAAAEDPEMLSVEEGDLGKDFHRHLLSVPPECDRTLNRLYALGLARRLDTGPTLHPLLAEFARSLANASALEHLAQALAMTSNQAIDTGLPAAGLLLRPHLQTVAQWAETHRLEDAGTLWNNLGSHMEMLAEYTLAQTAFTKALALNEQVFGTLHPKLVISLCNLGRVQSRLADLSLARSTLEQALMLGRHVLGPQNAVIVTILSNLGLVLKDQDNLPEALQAFRQALAIDKQLNRQGDPNATILNNLGMVLQKLNDLSAARDSYEQALAIWEKTLGPTHPQVSLALNNLGTLLQDMNNLPAAQEALQRALDIDRQVFEPQHPRIAIRYNNLGNVLYAQGNLAAARSAFEQTLAIWKTVLGDEHSQIAIGLNNLGMVLKDQGDLQAARQAYEQALVIDEKALKPQHSRIALHTYNLGCLLFTLGDLPAARTCFERSLGIYEVSLPPGHPDIERARRWLKRVDAQQPGPGACP